MIPSIQSACKTVANLPTLEKDGSGPIVCIETCTRMDRMEKAAVDERNDVFMLQSACDKHSIQQSDLGSKCTLKNEEDFDDDDDDENDNNSCHTHTCYDDRFDSMEVEMLYDAYDTAWKQLRTLVDRCKENELKKQHPIDTTPQQSNRQQKQAKTQQQRIVAWLVRPSHRKESTQTSIQVTIGLTLIPFEDTPLRKCIDDVIPAPQQIVVSMEQHEDSSAGCNQVVIEDSPMLNPTMHHSADIDNIQESNATMPNEEFAVVDKDEKHPHHDECALNADNKSFNESESNSTQDTNCNVNMSISPPVVSQHSSSCCSSPSHSSLESCSLPVNSPVTSEQVTVNGLNEIEITSPKRIMYSESQLNIFGQDHHITPKRNNRTSHSDLRKSIFSIHKDLKLENDNHFPSTNFGNRNNTPIDENDVLVQAVEYYDSGNVKFDDKSVLSRNLEVVRNQNYVDEVGVPNIKIDDKMLLLMLQSNSVNYNQCSKDERERWKMVRTKSNITSSNTKDQIDDDKSEVERLPLVTSLNEEDRLKMQQTTVYIRKTRNKKNLLETAQYFYNQIEVQNFLLDNYRHCSETLERQQVRREHRTLRRKERRLQQNNIAKSQDHSAAAISAGTILLGDSHHYNDEDAELQLSNKTKFFPKNNGQMMLHKRKKSRMELKHAGQSLFTESHEAPAHSSKKRRNFISNKVDNTANDRKKKSWATGKDICHKLIQVPTTLLKGLKTAKEIGSQNRDGTVNECSGTNSTAASGRFVTNKTMSTSSKNITKISSSPTEDDICSNINNNAANSKKRVSKRPRTSMSLAADILDGNGVVGSGIQLWCQRQCSHPKCWEAMWDHLQALGWSRIRQQQQQQDEQMDNNETVARMSKDNLSISGVPAMSELDNVYYYLPPKNGKVDGGRKGTHFFESQSEVMYYYRKRHSLTKN